MVFLFYNSILRCGEKINFLSTKLKNYWSFLYLHFIILFFSNDWGSRSSVEIWVRFANKTSVMIKWFLKIGFISSSFNSGKRQMFSMPLWNWILDFFNVSFCYNNNYTVRIQIPDVSSIWMVQTCWVVKWSSIQMAF